jgi:hypothetical protein
VVIDLYGHVRVHTGPVRVAAFPHQLAAHHRPQADAVLTLGAASCTHYLR